MKTMGKVVILLVVGLSMSMTSCGKKRRVTRTSADSVTDLSGKWNDTDAKLVAQEMIKDCLSRPWLQNFMSDNDRKPFVRISKVKNRSREHINVDLFTRKIERALLNSGKIRFRARKSEMKDIREAQDESMSGRVSDESAASVGNETQEDYLLSGTINTNVDQAEGIKAKYYIINMTLKDNSTSEKVWIGEKEIKKVVEQSGVSW